MQDRPEAPDLLDAIAELMIKEVLPLVQKHGDDALAFKTLVSWNMLGVVAREWRQSESGLNEELERLNALSVLAADSAPLPQTYPEKMERARERNRQLAETIREQKIGPENTEVLEHIRATIKEKLAISNPRYSLD